MSINQSNIHDRIVQQAATLIHYNDAPHAIELLQANGITPVQMEKILEIIQDSHLHLTKVGTPVPASDLKDRLFAVVNPKIAQEIPQASEQPTPPPLAERVQQIIPQAQVAPVEHLCFPAVSTSHLSEFSNPFPCRFEFGGRDYPSAGICWIAQQYSDRLGILPFFTEFNTEEEAIAFAELKPMTKERIASWENPQDKDHSKLGVLKHILRAKFGQNPHLRDKLLSTGSLFLACQGNDPLLGDLFNGTGQNKLGEWLMDIRWELGGTGRVPPSCSYTNMLLETSRRAGELLKTVPFDVWEAHIFPCLDLLSRLSCSYATKPWYENLFNSVRTEVLKLCPFRKMDTGHGEAPSIDAYELGKALIEMGPKIEGNAGVTRLVMRQGLTLNSLVQIAKDAGITVHVREEILIDLGDVAIGQTYVALITNNVFLNSRNKAYAEQKELVRKVGCELPELLDYIALCVLTQKNCQVWPYGRQDPWTYVRPSTQVRGNSLVVGSFRLSSLYVKIEPPRSRRDVLGAGGLWKFG